MQWISVKDRLPDISNSPEYKDLLAKTEDKMNFSHKHAEKLLAFSPSTIGITTAYYWGGNDDPMKGWSIMGVTHWMPLPSTPELELTK